MDVALLQAFIAVAETGSFSASANALHLTQPAISKRIALLEQFLDTRLFDRIGRVVTLTEAGETLIPRARRILQEISDTTRAIHDLGGAIAGKLQLATSHHIGLHRLPSVLREFRHSCPAVSLDIEFMDSEQALEAVIHGRAELGVITLPPKGAPGRLISRTIWPDPLVIMVSGDHALARTTQVTVTELAEYPAVLPGQGTYTGQILRQLFATQGVPLEVSMATNYLETLRMLVAIGLGWSLLPASMLTPGLQALSLRDGPLQRDLGLVYHRQRSVSNAARQFITLLDAQAREPTPQPSADHAG